jgi:thiol:disulfide interchange protein DsbD
MSRYCRLRRLFKRKTSPSSTAGPVVWSRGALAAAAFAIVLVAALSSPRPTPAQDSQNLPKSSEVVKIESLKLTSPLKPGGTSQLEVEAEILSGWHINSDKPLSPDFIPTKLTISPPDGVKAGAVSYPAAEEMALEFSGGDKLSVFSGMLAFEIALTPAASFKPAPSMPATVTLDYQPCNNNLCLRPAKITATVDLAQAKTSEAQPPAVAGGTGPPSDDSLVSGVFAKHGSILGFLFVLLAGVALNLTPCVYPLIGVTIAYFGNQGGTSRHMITLALTYVLGIALMFSSVGVAVALSGGLFGAALQNPYVLGAIATMLLMLAASSFGMFTLQPPQWLMNRAGVARPGYVGALAMGLGMGVVAAPCIGPVVLGLLLLVERSQSPLFGFALFFILAVGLGLPYVALALAAGSIRRLPRSGEWLAWVEQLFGFVLLGLAAYFIDPILPNHLVSKLLPYYAAAAGIFLGFVTPAGRNWRPFWVLRMGFGTLSGAALAYLLLIPASAPARIAFQPYDASLLEAAKSSHRPVVIDFAATWCIPCREMDSTTFVDPNVRSAAARFVALKADVTAQDDKTDRLTREFGVQGVPTAVFIDSQGQIRKRVAGFINSRDFVDDLRQID